MNLRCALGLHDDGTDAFGGYSPTCLRCGRPSSTEAGKIFGYLVFAISIAVIIWVAVRG